MDVDLAQERVAGVNESMPCAGHIRDSRIAGVVIGSGTEVSIFSKILHVGFAWINRGLE